MLDRFENRKSEGAADWIYSLPNRSEAADWQHLDQRLPWVEVLDNLGSTRLDPAHYAAEADVRLTLHYGHVTILMPKLLAC